MKKTIGLLLALCSLSQGGGEEVNLNWKLEVHGSAATSTNLVYALLLHNNSTTSGDLGCIAIETNEGADAVRSKICGGTVGAGGTRGALILSTRTSGGAMVEALRLIDDQSASFAGAVSVAGQTTLSGIVGIGAAPSSGVNVNANATLSASTTDQYGVFSRVTASSSATNSGNGMYSQGKTAAASFHQKNTSAYYADNCVAGATSTIDTCNGLNVAALTGGAANASLHTRTGKALIDDSLFVGRSLTLAKSGTPDAPASSGPARLYFVGDTLTLQYNDGGTVRYKWLKLGGTDSTWHQGTTAP